MLSLSVPIDKTEHLWSSSEELSYMLSVECRRFKPNLQRIGVQFHCFDDYRERYFEVSLKKKFLYAKRANKSNAKNNESQY